MYSYSVCVSVAFGMLLSAKDDLTAESVCHGPDALESLLAHESTSKNWHRAGESAHDRELVPKWQSNRSNKRRQSIEPNRPMVHG